MRRRPGEIRDAIVQVLEGRRHGANVQTITNEVIEMIGDVPPSQGRARRVAARPRHCARSVRGLGFDIGGGRGRRLRAHRRGAGPRRLRAGARGPAAAGGAARRQLIRRDRSVAAQRGGTRAELAARIAAGVVDADLTEIDRGERRHGAIDRRPRFAVDGLDEDAHPLRAIGPIPDDGHGRGLFASSAQSASTSRISAP